MTIPPDSHHARAESAEGSGTRSSAGGAALVSVVMPCRDVSAYVEGAVRSVMAQEHRPMELIAVDDGSTDGTLEALRRLALDAVLPFRVLAQEGRGANAARNAGMRAASGGYVQFLDADDALLPGKIARQAALLGSGADAAAGAFINLFEDGRPEEVVKPWDGDAWEGLVRTRLGTTSANLFRRSAVEAVGGWDEALRSSQDYELLFRMMKAGARLAIDPIPGCRILKREQGSISRTGARENWLRYLELRLAMRDHLRAMGPDRHSLVGVCDSYLFNGIRVLSTLDRASAIAAHRRMIPKHFRPRPDAATTSRYVAAYRVLGFRWAERIADLFSRR